MTSRNDTHPVRAIARGAIGWLAVGLSLVLASPGVRVATAGASAGGATPIPAESLADSAEFDRFVRFQRADEAARPSAAPPVAAAAPGAACQAGPGRVQRRAAAEFMREVQQRSRARLQPGVPAAELGNGIVLLNGRGYNYGPGPVIDPGQLASELRLQR